MRLEPDKLDQPDAIKLTADAGKCFWGYSSVVWRSMSITIISERVIRLGFTLGARVIVNSGV